MTPKTRSLAATLALGLATAGVLTGCSRTVTEEVNAYEITERITTLVVEADAAAIDLVTGDGPVTVEEKLRWSNQKPDVTHRVEGETLRLVDRGCESWLNVECETSYEIRVPAATAVRITTDAGRVQIRDLRGDLEVESDAGAIEATGLHSGTVVARADAGRVTLRFVAPPRQVTARSDAGAVAVHLPRGTSYAVDAGTDAGRTEIAVSQDPASPNRISAHTSAGAVTVTHA